MIKITIRKIQSFNVVIYYYPIRLQLMFDDLILKQLIVNKNTTSPRYISG